MRLDPIAPGSMTDEQRALHEDMVPAVHEHLQGFVPQRADGALLGPFPPMLAWPAWGGPAWAQTKSMMTRSVLPKPAHEVAVLVVGGALQARYEVYAHQHVGEAAGLPAAKVATISAGQRPADLDAEEAAAYDLAAALTRGGPVPRTTWQVAVDAFGDEGAAELVYLVGTYCFVSVLLNGFDMTVPGSDTEHPEVETAG